MTGCTEIKLEQKIPLKHRRNSVRNISYISLYPVTSSKGGSLNCSVTVMDGIITPLWAKCFIYKICIVGGKKGALVHPQYHKFILSVEVLFLQEAPEGMIIHSACCTSGMNQCCLGLH